MLWSKPPWYTGGSRKVSWLTLPSDLIYLHSLRGPLAHMLTIDEKSAKNKNLAIWLNPLKLGDLQTPQDKKTLG
jgi:hypothetical protein